MPLIQPLLDGVYPTVAYGDGVFLTDSEGRRYLDGCSGAVTAGLGHALQEIVDVMAEQARRVAFSYRLQFRNQPADDLAALLEELAPGDIRWTFFVNSGSEATETAQKMAIQYWREAGRPEKTVVLSRRLSYHGITLGALSMSGHRARRSLFEPLLTPNAVVVPPYCYRCPLGKTYPECNVACADDLQQNIDRLGAEQVAAFAMEPVIGAAGGAIVPPQGYFQRIREICDRNEVLLIADEVMTAMGRTGAMFAMEHWGVEPDLIALGKGLSAGYTPLAATLASDHLVQTIRAGSGAIMSGHTYSANPLSCAVGLAVVRYVQKHDLARRAATLGPTLGERLEGLRARHPIVGDVRGLGLLWGLELVADPVTRTPFPTNARVTARLVAAAQEQGLLIYPALAGAGEGTGDAVIVAPPLTIDEAELGLLGDLLDRSLTALEDTL
ncbi:MAG: aspartate aminotransferase family protein [Actinobacteria bacterium]|nr:aspartate aminotransferase family protein [Actinomycetota bacterium]